MTDTAESVTIKNLSAMNVAAIRDTLAAKGVRVVTTATTATFEQMTREQAYLIVQATIRSLPGRAHPKASLHAVARRLATTEAPEATEATEPAGDITTAAGRRANSEARQAARQSEDEPGTMTLTSKGGQALKTGTWHIRNNAHKNAVTTFCGLVLQDDTKHGISVHIVPDIDERAIQHGSRPVCSNCRDIRAHKFNNGTTTTEEVTMSSMSTQANPDPKEKDKPGAKRTTAKRTTAKRTQAKRGSGRKRTGTKRTGTTKTTTAAAPAAAKGESPAELVTALTAEVRKHVTGVKVEPGPGGVRVYFRLKIGDATKTLGFARKGDRKAAVQVGSEARETLTKASVEKVAKRMSSRADALKAKA